MRREIRWLVILLVLPVAAAAAPRAVKPKPASAAGWDAGAGDPLWAFKPVRQPRVPPNAAGGPIDAFLDAKLKAAGVRPAPPADRLTLIRRATFDLHGLPPTPEEVDAFAADPLPTPRAFEKVVDRLLASPRYGERNARHWLDVVRYADTGGGSNDFERPNAWRYRDYVIRSFNQDKPYDRFVIEQIAGDELLEETRGNAEMGGNGRAGKPPGSAISSFPHFPISSDSLIATGFLRMGPWEHTGMSVEAVTRQQWLDDVTNSTAVTFLGLSGGCARCHDHKFDPIPTKDYYRLQAVFAATRFAERPAEWLPAENRSRFEADASRIREKLRRLQEKLAAMRQKSVDAVVRQRGAASAAELPRAVVDEAVRQQLGFGSEDLERDRIYRKWIQLYQAMLPRYEPRAFAVTTGEPGEVHVLAGGRLTSPGEKVSAGVLGAVGKWSAHSEPSFAPEPAGRRLALARWIAGKDNPLTARVIVNRVWQWHFGRGLVETSNNFGKMGKRPSHPELLDFLASVLVAPSDSEWGSGRMGEWEMRSPQASHSVTWTGAGWSLKALTRMMLVSAAYQRSGHAATRHAALRPNAQRPTPRAANPDPENRLLAYFPIRRLEAEELRDSILAAAGELSAEAGGPGTFPEINEELARQPRQVMGTIAPAWEPSPSRAERNRRTIYTYQQRSMLDPLVEVFNGANPNDSCERRLESTVAPQVFSLFNSRFSHDMALAFANRVVSDRSDRSDRSGLINRAFRLAFQRLPTADERAAALAHLEKMTAYHRAVRPATPSPPERLARTVVVEQTGERIRVEEETDPAAYEPNFHPSQASAETRALAELCLVLLNSNEFVYVY